MLENYKRNFDGLDKKTRKSAKKDYQKKISALLNPLKESKIPVIVLVEGWASSGKGGLINELISEIDPRFSSVFTLESALEGSERYPFLYPYFKAIPENGKILFMDGGYLTQVVNDDVHGKYDKEAIRSRIESINNFERQLVNDGYKVIKFFINFSKKNQAKSFEKLLASKNDSWRVTDDDLFQNKHYKDFEKGFDKWMNVFSVTPWHILDGNDKETIYYDAFKFLYNELDGAIKAGKFNGLPYEETFNMSTPLPSLEDADLCASLTDEEYKKELKKLQGEIHKLHRAIYRKKIPMIVAYEGWDAAGKGGNIRRLAKPLDPRGFDTYPIASPEPHEKARHHLWRFWTRLPKAGHVAIFDRTWYGRVMVERLEGFCSENDWKRAYNEINEFEKELTDAGVIVIKFWIQIDKDTQLARFTDRQNTPEKQWKITDEDWRNREKWDAYEEAVSEMIAKTSTAFAPWHIIESVDKKYARVKALRIVKEAMEKALEGHS